MIVVLEHYIDTSAVTHSVTVGSFHLLHMMIDNYLLHTLEAQFEHLQETDYKNQMLSHYSESGIVYVTCVIHFAWNYGLTLTILTIIQTL